MGVDVSLKKRNTHTSQKKDRHLLLAMLEIQDNADAFIVLLLTSRKANLAITSFRQALW